jgi:chemotaxis protein MotA
MNFAVPTGLFIAVAIIAYLMHEGVNTSTILNMHAAVVVVGGTLSAAFICAGFTFLWQMAKVFWYTISGRTRAQLYTTLGEIVRLSEHLDNGGRLEEVIPQVKNHFLRELLELAEKAGLEKDQFDEVVSKRLEQQNERYRRDSYLFKTIGKFPPAFGLVGTTVGMIALLQGLGAADAFQKIGPAMSLALVATFYGLVLSNFVLIPVGENLHLASEEDLTMRHIVADGVRLLLEKRHPLLVQEYLVSYLPPGERYRLKDIIGGQSRAKAA